VAAIRDTAITIFTTATASMVCEMPVHETGDLLVAFVNKDTASLFTTPGGWDALQTQTSAGAGGGLYARRATSSSETVTFTLTSETCCAVIIAVKNVNGSTVADAVSGSAKSGADDTTLPYTGIGITPSHNNCLILHGLSADIGFGPSAYPGWVNLFTGDATANSLCVAYTRQITAAAISAPDHWGAVVTGVDCRGFIVAIRDDGNNSEVDPYIAPGTTPCTLISPLVFVSGNVDKGTWELVTNDITSVGGKTMNQVDPVAAADSGYNPFRAAVRVVAASSTVNLTASEMRFAAAQDFTGGAGVLLGTLRFQVPRDFLDCSKPSNGGVLIGIADAENDHRFWTVAAQFSKSTDASSRMNYAIEVQTTDTVYATSGTIAFNAINDLYLAGAGYYGACSVEWSDLYLLNEVVLAGGTSGTPLDFLDLEAVINDGSGRIPLFVRAGSAATIWTPIRFGGVDPIHLGINLRTFQFPRKADEVDYLDFHVSNNKMGIEFFGLSGDTFGFTGCVFTSDSPYYWRFNASHNAGATLDFSGSTIVNATVTLRSTVSLSEASFVNCPTFTQNNAALAACNFDGTLVTSDNPADLSDCSFTSSGTGHGIEITTPGTYTFSGNTFSGYGADGTTDAAIYNNSGGAVTLNITGGGSTPTVRNGAGASTTLVINPVTLTITVRNVNTAAVVQSAHALILADAGGPFPADATVTITRTGSTATVAHTAHGLTTGHKVRIKGANEQEYNGIYTITVTNVNEYTYTVSGSPATPATGTIKSSLVIIDALTNASGQVSDTRPYGSNQPFTGVVRKGSSATAYKAQPATGTISSASGADVAVQLIPDG
jgi:hypothetical protein